MFSLSKIIKVKVPLVMVISLVILFFFLYYFKLDSSYIFNTDIARDSYGIIEIAQGKLTLIGPKLNFGGYFAGPYYYYMFAPILLLGRYEFKSILMFNSLLFAISLSYFFWKLRENYSAFWAIISTIAVGLFPIYITAARNPGNAYTYIPFIIIFLTYVYFNDIEKKLELFLLGLLAGIIINFHLLNVLVFGSMGLFMFLNLKNKYKILYFILGIIIPFVPLLVFEVRHDFVIIKRSIYDFLNANLVRDLDESRDKYATLNNILKYPKVISTYLTIHPIFYAVLFLLPAFFRKIKNRRNFLFTMFALFSFFIFVLISHGVLDSHYVFPVSVFIFFALLMYALSYNLKIIVLIIIFGELINFNFGLYKLSVRPYSKFEKAVNYVIDNNFVDKQTPFNIIQILNPEVNVPAGYEYRYFFRKRGFLPNTVNEYDKSKILFAFSEIGKFDIDSLVNWETGQFGISNLKNRQSYKVDDIWIYKIEREN
jgi:hypothetical protein